VRVFAPRETALAKNEFVLFPALGLYVGKLVARVKAWAHNERRDGALLRTGCAVDVDVPFFPALALRALTFPTTGPLGAPAPPLALDLVDEDVSDDDD